MTTTSSLIEETKWFINKWFTTLFLYVLVAIEEGEKNKEKKKEQKGKGWGNRNMNTEIEIIFILLSRSFIHSFIDTILFYIIIRITYNYLQ